MKTHAKLRISAFTIIIIALLNVFSKPLHIPEPFQWVLIIGVFIPLSFVFRLTKKLKLERVAMAGSAHAPERAREDFQKKARRGLLLSMVLGSALALCSPFWMPMTGNSLGNAGDFIVGLITAAFVCTVCGLKLRRI